jgi:hypothetical protein
MFFLPGNSMFPGFFLVDWNSVKNQYIISSTKVSRNSCKWRSKNNKIGESPVKFVCYQAFLEVDYYKNDWK